MPARKSLFAQWADALRYALESIGRFYAGGPNKF